MKKALVKLFHCFESQFVQARTAMRHIVQNLLPHTRLPESIQMILDACDGFRPGIGSEKERNLVGHVNHRLSFHG